MNAAAPRQTLSYLRTLFTERGIRPKNKLGQNFLIDLNLLELIVREAQLSPEDLVLEVGSGTGSLTTYLISQAGALACVELDPPFAALTEEAVELHYTLFATDPAHAKGVKREHVRLLRGDALANKNHLNPAVLAAVAELLPLAGTKHVKLIANLPYAVAVPVISNLLLTDLPVERMVVMVQWEIAQRLTAVPGTKEYASLAVLVQSLTDVTLVRQLKPSAFWPRPLVDSAIVMIKPNAAKRAHVGDVMALRNFLRDLYVHRRKNLRGALSSLPSGKRLKADVDAKLAEMGIPGTTRAEDLDLETHLRLCRAFG
jgi:16S rRNA (adenine1518-N6/adenine1519-N6)-dimethyltransferase